PATAATEAERSLVRAAAREADLVLERESTLDDVRSALERAAVRLATARPRAELPETLAGLGRLAGNLWWSWDVEATALFETLAPEAWERGRHDPGRMLRFARA